MRGSRRYVSTPWLVVSTVLVLVLAQGPARVHATFIPDTFREQMRSRIHQHQLLSDMARASSAAQPAPQEAPSTRTSRMLAATPAPIRILPEFQVSTNLSASTQATIRAVVAVAIQTLQTYLQIRVPSGSTGLLAPPQYVSAPQCTDIANNPSSYGGQTCSGAGWYPTFGSLPTTDYKNPSCGTATMNPAHVLSSSCFDSSTRAVSCSTGSSGANGGLQTDFYLYVTTNSGACPTNVAAFALPCLFDIATNRPVLGALNLCTVAITAYTTDKLLATVTHEITHALGFTNDLFNFYIDPSTNKALTSAKVVATVPAATTAGMRGSYTMVITPAVLREVRLQFNCPTLAGAAMEDQGGSGSAGSHWEYELFQGDLMTPTKPADSSSQRFSRMTLALMEDSGWYISNWTAAPYLDWGRNAGCSLPQQTCTAYSAGTPGQPYFCSAAATTATTKVDTCSFNGIAHGYCSSNTFANCGIVNTPAASAAGPPTVVQPNCVSTSYNNGGQNEVDGAAAFRWAIGAAARCLSTSLPITSTSGLSLKSTSATSIGFCWTAACTSGGSLTYSIAGQSVACPAGQTVTLNLVSSSITAGAVTCPTEIQAAAVCMSLQCPSTGCQSPGGSCFDGACVCRIGSGGADCSQDLVSQALSLPPSPSPPPPSTTNPSNQGAGTSGSGSGVTGGTAPSPSPPPGRGSSPSDEGFFSGKNKTIIIIAASVAGGVILLAVVAIIFVKASQPSAVAPAKPEALAPGTSPFTPGPNMQPVYAPPMYPAPAAGYPPQPYGPPGYPPPVQPHYAPPQQPYYPPPGPPHS